MASRVVGIGLVALAAAASACSSEGRAGSAPASSAPSAPAGRACVMWSGGSDVLRLTVPPGARCTPYDGLLQLESGHRHMVSVWMVPGAAGLDDGVGRVAGVIAPEFKGFTATQTESLTVAGAPAKRLLGTGVEADDDDPGRADVVVFRAGSRVFVACTHGESMSPKAEEFMMALVGTAAAP